MLRKRHAEYEMDNELKGPQQNDKLDLPSNTRPDAGDASHSGVFPSTTGTTMVTQQRSNGIQKKLKWLQFPPETMNATCNDQWQNPYVFYDSPPASIRPDLTTQSGEANFGVRQQAWERYYEEISARDDQESVLYNQLDARTASRTTGVVQSYHITNQPIQFTNIPAPDSTTTWPDNFQEPPATKWIFDPILQQYYYIDESGEFHSVR